MARTLNTRRIIKRFYRPGWRRPFWLVMTLVVVPLLVGRVMLNPLLERLIRHRLGSLQTIAAASFSDLDVFLFPPSFTFRDVIVRGPSGEGLEVDRLEIHLATLGDLRSAEPHLRARLVHPTLRLVPGAGDLERWARALPTARFDVTGVENGSVAGASNVGGDGRAFLQALSGDIEGLATGSALGAAGVGWQTRMDGRLDGTDPLHLLFRGEPSGAWQATLTVQQRSESGPPSGGGPITIDVRAKGQGDRVRAAMNVSWPGSEVPVAVAQNRIDRIGRIGRVAGSWPTGGLSVAELRAGAGGTGQSLQVVAVSAGDGAPAAALKPFDIAALALELQRLANQALLPPPPGMAALTEGVPAQATGEAAPEHSGAPHTSPEPPQARTR